MNNKDNNINLNRYDTDVDGVSLKTLERGLWFTRNKKNIKNILIGLLALVSILSCGYAIYGWGYYLLVGMNADESMTTNLLKTNVVSQSYLESRKPKDLIFSSAGYVNNNGKYDFYEKISNPNSQYSAYFNYCFNSGGSSACGKSFVLPEDSKYIVSLAQSGINSSGLNFSISDLSWKKINNHIIPNWKTYYTSHLPFDLSNQLFSPSSSNTNSSSSLNSLSFTITNNTAYSYWDVPLTIVLSNGSSVNYLTSYTINSFASHDSDNVNLTWSGTISNVSGISIVPDIDILDQNVYQKPQ
jgi:hypothetical protein